MLFTTPNTCGTWYAWLCRWAISCASSSSGKKCTFFALSVKAMHTAYTHLERSLTEGESLARYSAKRASLCSLAAMRSSVATGLRWDCVLGATPGPIHLHSCEKSARVTDILDPQLLGKVRPLNAKKNPLNVGVPM